MILNRRGVLSLAALSMAPRRSVCGGPIPEPGPRNRLLLGGDVMLSRYVGRLARQQRDPGWPLRELAPPFSSADIAFVNRESPFSDRGRPVEKWMVFKAEPEMIEALVCACGLDHQQSYARLRGARRRVHAGMARQAWHRGSGHRCNARARASRRGARAAWRALWFSGLHLQSNGNHADREDRVAMMNVDEMTSDVRNIRERADVAIMSMHAGVEYQRNATTGAKVVVGRHPHVAQPLENYASGLIFYSLGNPVFDQIFAGERIAGYGVIPVDMVRTAPRVHSPAPSQNR